MIISMVVNPTNFPIAGKVFGIFWQRLHKIVHIPDVAVRPVAKATANVHPAIGAYHLSAGAARMIEMLPLVVKIESPIRTPTRGPVCKVLDRQLAIYLRQISLDTRLV